MHEVQDISADTLLALKSSVLDAVVAIDAEGKIVAWNDLAVDMFGWSETEALGQHLGDLIVPEQHREAHHNGMLRYLSTGVATVVRRRIEITALNREGVEFPVELSIIPAAQGGPAAFIGFIRDITERRSAQERLSVSEESLRLATDSAEIGTWDLDMLTDALTWSDRTKKMFGISPDTSCSMKDFYDGLHPDDRDATTEAFATALDPRIRATYDVEYRTVGKEDGRVRWVAAKGKGFFDKAGRCVRAVGTAIDITGSKEAYARQLVLDQLTELMRSTDTVRALNDACELMGRHFAVSRVGYGQLDADEDIFSYTVCWTNGQVPPLLGEYPAHVFGEQIVARLTAGKTVVVDDLFDDEISNEATTLETATKVDTRSILVVPFLRGERLRTIVYLNDQKPRAWTRDEILFMETVAERTRQLVDKAESEAIIAERDEEFRSFAQAMPNHAWMADTDGQLYWFNTQVYAYSGAEEGSIDGENWARLVHPDDVATAAAAWGQALIAGVIYETQFRIRRHDGDYRWHIIRAIPVIGAHGQVMRWIGTNTDIHDQKIAEEALSESRQSLRAILDSAGEAFYATDTEGTTTLCNSAFVRMLGFENEDAAVGRKLHDLIHHTHPDGSHYPKHDCPIYRCAMTGEAAHVDNELFFRLDGSAFPVEYRASPILRDGVVQGTICTFTDITERRRNEMLLREMNETLETRVREAVEELETANAALRQAQKMEAVGQLTGGIAHDFNNMLAVVSGSLQLLDRRIVDDPRAKRHIASAMDAAKRSATLTQRLLAFSRQQPLRPEVINPNKLVTGMSDLFSHSLGAQIQLETVLSAGIWRIHADQNELENVLLNLAVNARDAMPDGGKLTIETQNAFLDDRYVSMELGVTPGQYVLLAITDSGTGMPPEVLEKAFDPFFTTKEIGKGTGLGLSQVYGFVKQSGGHIKVYSELGEGTTIKVYLPRHVGIEAEAQESQVEILRSDAQELILVVDDEPIVRQFSVDALMELGYRVLEADGAATAIAILKERPDIDLLFTDIIMPETNGRKLVDMVRAFRPDLPVIYTTGYTRNAVVHNGVVDHGVELIGKPFTLEELALKVRNLLDGRHSKLLDTRSKD